MKYAILWITFFLCFSFCLGEDEGFDLWSWATFNIKLDQTWNIKLREDFRFIGGEYSEQQNWVFLGYNDLPEYIDFGLGYRLVHKEDSGGKFRRENRSYIDLILKTTVLGLKCSDRNRLEYRDFENKDDVFRYRNQLQFSFSNDLFDLPLRPYIGDEIFIQENKGFYRNWVRGGVVWNINDHFNMNFFGIYQLEKKKSEWNNLAVGGIEMVFNF